jgi:hypothetical protein
VGNPVGEGDRLTRTRTTGALGPLDAQIRKGVTDAGTPNHISALHLLKALSRLQDSRGSRSPRWQVIWTRIRHRYPVRLGRWLEVRCESARCESGSGGKDQRTSAVHRQSISCRTVSQLNGYICQCGHNPKCRHDHRLKRQPRWTVDQLPDGTFRWTTPSGRDYTTGPTRYPA